MSEQAKHTPGPWKSVSGERGPEIVDGTTLVLAEVNTFELHPAGSLPTRDEVLANARVIAAAPELLEALKALYRVVAELTVEDPTHYAVATKTAAAGMAAHLAIAKATGVAL